LSGNPSPRLRAPVGALMMLMFHLNLWILPALWLLIPTPAFSFRNPALQTAASDLVRMGDR
jgi:hypothetical protein